MRRNQNGKKELFFVPVAFLAVLLAFGVFAICSSVKKTKEPAPEGVSYVSMEEGKNPREVQEKINGETETAPDVTEPDSPSESEKAPETEPVTEPETEPAEDLYQALKQ